MKMIKSVRAEGYVLPCVFIIIFAMLLTMIMTYTATVSKVNIMIENSKVVLDSFVTENSVGIYESIKQGNDYTEVINQEEYRKSLIEFCTFVEKNNSLYSMDANGTENYHITNPVVSFREENQLELVANYDIIIPISFAGMSFTTVSVPIEISSILTEKF